MKRIKNISLLRRMSIFRGFIVLLSLYLLIASILPLFGWQLFIYGPFKLDAFDPIVGNALFLVITKSASFMTLSFFALNYLQNRKPLSSVAPLLVYSNFTIIFGVIFLIQSDNTQWSHWTLVFLLSVISVILFQENRKEAKKIFRDDWWKAGNNSLRKVLSSDRRIMLLELRMVGAEGRTWTGTSKAHYPLKIACLPIPPLRQFDWTLCC